VQKKMLKNIFFLENVCIYQKKVVPLPRVFGKNGRLNDVSVCFSG
jgi:hypothetical protein